jgi:predicted transcriptional regulator
MRNMKTDTKTISKKNDGQTATVTREVVEQYNKAEMMQKISQVSSQQQNIVNQMSNLKTQYDNFAMQISEYAELLSSFEDDVPSVGA